MKIAPRLLVALAAAMALAVPAAAALEEGIDYLLAPDAAPVPARDATVRVTEFFNISCPACNAWQEPIDEWLVDAPDNIEWLRTPVPFTRWDGLYAKSFFVLEAFGREELLADFFRAYHGERRLLNSEGRIAEWLAEEHGLIEDDVEEAFGSFGVDTKMRRAQRMIARFGISATPTFMVADRYILSPSISKTPERLFETIDGLISAIREGTAT